MPASPFTCFAFHGFATQQSGCIKFFKSYFGKISCLFCCDLEVSVVRENPLSELRVQLPTGSGTDGVRSVSCEYVILRLHVETDTVFV